MAYQEQYVLDTFRFRERKGPKQDKRKKRLDKLSRKAERKARRESSDEAAA